MKPHEPSKPLKKALKRARAPGLVVKMPSGSTSRSRREAQTWLEALGFIGFIIEFIRSILGFIIGFIRSILGFISFFF